MKINEIAQTVAFNYTKRTGEAAFDLSMIPVIMEIISNLVELFKECEQTPTSALKSVKNPSRWDRIVLNMAVRRQIGFRRERETLVNALLKTGESLNEQDIKDLYYE